MIFERWILAADRLGPFWSGATAYTVNDLSQVLNTCGEPTLALDLARYGPRALTQLDMEHRNALAAKMEPTLRPSLKRFLLSEAMEMERRVGTDTPCRFVVFGKISDGEIAASILKSEFPNQRGAAISLDRPGHAAIGAFDQSRHQILWTEPPSSRPRKNVGRPERLRTELHPGELWDLSRLARMNPRGQLYSSFAQKPFVAMESGELIRFGGLSVMGSVNDDAGPETAADVLFASGIRNFDETIPISFLRSQENQGVEEGPQLADRARFFLGEVQENYGRIDFDPIKRTVSVSVLRSRTRSTIATTTFRLHKDHSVSRSLLQLRSEVRDMLAETIFDHLKGGPRRRRNTLLQAERTVDIVFPAACRYVEWLERNPEASVAEREERLGAFETAMTDELPPALQKASEKERQLLRRDVYRVFEQFVAGWGFRPAL